MERYGRCQVFNHPSSQCGQTVSDSESSQIRGLGLGLIDLSEFEMKDVLKTRGSLFTWVLPGSLLKDLEGNLKRLDPIAF